VEKETRDKTKPQVPSPPCKRINALAKTSIKGMIRSNNQIIEFFIIFKFIEKKSVENNCFDLQALRKPEKNLNPKL